MLVVLLWPAVQVRFGYGPLRPRSLRRAVPGDSLGL